MSFCDESNSSFLHNFSCVLEIGMRDSDFSSAGIYRFDYTSSAGFRAEKRRRRCAPSRFNPSPVRLGAFHRQVKTCRISIVMRENTQRLELVRGWRCISQCVLRTGRRGPGLLALPARERKGLTVQLTGRSAFLFLACFFCCGCGSVVRVISPALHAVQSGDLCSTGQSAVESEREASCKRSS
eukprot:COSAG02_NODE_4894_length_4852_cov_26.531664_2_plen_183_part_00